jgi:hypothetical protein
MRLGNYLLLYAFYIYFSPMIIFYSTFTLCHVHKYQNLGIDVIGLKTYEKTYAAFQYCSQPC